jgi:hypothetical protein
MPKFNLTLLLLAGASICAADSITPIFEWTGAPTLFANGALVSASESANAITTFANCWMPATTACAISQGYNVVAPFAVTTAGEFQLSDSLSVQASAFSQDPGDITSNWAITLSWSAYSFIIATASTSPISDKDNAGTPRFQSFFVSQSSPTVLASLDVGNYTLVQSYGATITGFNSSLLLNMETDLAGVDPPAADPIPEPRMLWLIPILFLPFLWKNWKLR